MSFVVLKFLHVAFMFFGVALAIGPTALLVQVLRSGDAQALRATLPRAERVFQVSTVSYGLGILFGLAAAVTGTLDLTAPWLVIAYVLVALLGVHGVLFDRWTKRAVSELDALAARRTRDRVPLYYLSAMTVLVVAILYVMVAKPSLF